MHPHIIKHILIAIMLTLAGIASGNVIEVCPDCPVRTIKEGIRLAAPCDTVLVNGGTYSEGKISIEKELTLLGKNLPILDGLGQSEILTIAAHHFTIEGFQLQNVGTSYTEDRASIRIREGRQFTIRNNRILNGFFAIYLQQSKGGVVEGNYIEGDAKEEVSSGNAIHLWYCEDVLIRNNEVFKHRDGIYLEFVNNSTVTGNLSEANLRYGLHFMFSNDNIYRGNTFRHNGAGVAVMYSRRIEMQHNIFERNWGPAAYGLLLKEIHDSEINSNIFRQNTVGIFTETSNRLRYAQNQFISNGWAIKMSGGCQQNTVTGNNFLSNSFDLAVQNVGQENSFDGNYWDGYAGYDLDRNGAGDVPHRPMKLFSYVVSRTPESIVLLRSLFIDILNFSEKVSPIFTPENVVDNEPKMKPLTQRT